VSTGLCLCRDQPAECICIRRTECRSAPSAVERESFVIQPGALVLQGEFPASSLVREPQVAGLGNLDAR